MLPRPPQCRGSVNELPGLKHKQPPDRAAVVKHVEEGSGDPEGRLRLAAVRHEANAQEAQDHHCPGGGLWDGGNGDRIKRATI